MQSHSFFTAVCLFAATICSGNTVLFSGKIIQSNAPGITVGTAFSGRFTYSPADPVWPQVANPQLYFMSSSGDAIDAVVGAFNFHVGTTGKNHFSPALSVGDEPGGVTFPPGYDYLQVGVGCCNAPTTTNYAGYHVSGISIQFFGTPSLVPSTAIPLSIDPANIFFSPTNGSTSFSLFLTNADNTITVKVFGPITAASQTP